MALSCFSASLPCFAAYSAAVSTSSSEAPEKTLSAADLNAPGALRGAIAPGGLYKKDWSAQLVFFGDSMRGLPAFQLKAAGGRNSLRLLYGDYALPRLKDRGSFLRANGVDVKELITSVTIDGNTATYSSDAITGFRTLTRTLALYYGREVYQGEFAVFSLLAGAGGLYRFYSVDCLLSDNSPFRERASSYGLLLSSGLEVSFRAPAAIKRGFEASLYLTYEKVWLHGGGKRLSRPLAEKLENFRLALGVGWRFNFYE